MLRKRGEKADAKRRIPILCVTAGMSLEWIAAGVLVCLFGLIALMPPFDGKWGT